MMEEEGKKDFFTRIAPFSVCLWLLCVLNTVFVWFPLGIFLRYIAFCGVFVISLVIAKTSYANKNVWPIFFTFLFLVWISVHYGISATLRNVASFVPLLLLYAWPKSLLYSSYKLFRYVVLFFCVGSSVITVLSFVGLTNYIPFFEMPAQSPLHINRGDYYYVYGIFPELHSVGDVFYRACGMMEEPGHFSVILGLIYIIDRITHRKINPLIIICAVLTFSSNFLFAVLFVELKNIFHFRNKVLFWVSGVIVFSVIIYCVLPEEIQDMVYNIAYERNFGKASETYSETNSFTSLLDNRANDHGTRLYNSMTTEELAIGGLGDKNVVLSDYRGMILNYGWIGLMISWSILLALIYKLDKVLLIGVLLYIFIIFLHRSWMYFLPYMYFFVFLVASFCQKNMIYGRISKK